MALKKSVIFTKTGFSGSLVANDAYWKIKQISGSKTQLMVEVSAFIDDAEVEKFVCSFAPNLDGRNFIAQAYDHLKTLPEFAGAVDC